MTLRNIGRVSLIFRPALFLGLGLLISLAVLFVHSEKQMAKVSELETNPGVVQTMPNLNGKEAEEYLKKQGLHKSLGEAMAASRYSIYPTNNAPLPKYKEAFEANNPRQAFSTYFAKDGIHLVSNAKNNKWRVQMNLKGYSQGEGLTKLEETKTEVQKNKSRIELTKTAIQDPNSKIVEWYENQKDGLEQGWTIDEKLSDSDEELKLILELGGDLKPKLAIDKQAINFVKENDEQVLRYDKLKSWDSNGKELTSRMELKDKQLSIVVEEKDAKYPITIDPFFTQTKKITASDSAESDQFGYSVAVSGDTVVVGAPFDNDDGEHSGSAYIFERNTGGTANNWGEVKKLTASDADADDFFGFSVGISGDTAIVGAYGNSDDGFQSGSAYIFERNAGGAANNWGEVRRLTASDATAGDNFGYSIGISGDTVIIGASRNDIPEFEFDSGAAYIFERNNGGVDNWGEVKVLTKLSPRNNELFGWSVAISGDTAIVGAVGVKAGLNRVGSAFVFERNTGGADNWGHLKQLGTGSAADDRFGTSVAISGDTAIVGSPKNDLVGSDAGLVKVFERNAGGINNWGEIKSITAVVFAPNANFGRSVAISNDTFIVGAYQDDLNGTVYIFERNMGGADNWGEAQELKASDATIGDRFGWSVGISGDTVIVGAIWDDDDGSASGSSYLFTNVHNNWSEVTSKTVRGGTASNQLGYSVSISGDIAIVGELNGESGLTLSDTGAAYIFERNQGGANVWSTVVKLNASDAAVGDQFGHSVSISNDTVIVGAWENDDDGGRTGAAYIFERNTGGADSWGEVKKLLASDMNGGDRFGWAVGISGDTAIVSAKRNDDGGFQTGSAYIFERNKNGVDNWGQVKKILAFDPFGGDEFGQSVAISVDTVIVGAWKDDDDGSASGSAYIFERNTGGVDNWGSVKKLTAIAAAGNDEFGFSVAISDDTAIVGAHFADEPGIGGSGAAHIFYRNQGGANNWGEVKRITASVPVATDIFGHSVAISGDKVIVGAYGWDNGDLSSDGGAAYIFERNTGGADNWGEVKMLIASDIAAGDEFGLSVGISGDTALVGAHLANVGVTLAGKLTEGALSKDQSNLVGIDQGRVYLFNALAAPTAASASISGKVTLSNGRALLRTTVHITDQNGDTRTATTNQFGYFRFDDIEVGQILIINAFHRQYQFNPQVIQLDDSITKLIITPQ
jgi:hypothetical protein